MVALLLCGRLRLPTGLTEDTEVNISHLYIVDADVNHIRSCILFVTGTIFFRTLDVVHMRKRWVVFRIFIDFIGLLLVLFITGNTQVGRDDIGFLVSAIPAIVNQLPFLGHLHVVEVVAFHAEVHC